MEKEIIHVDKKYTYLNEFMDELPVNCLFDKGRTGCGGTTIAIENNKNTIIAMPYVNLIKNKEVQYPDVLFGIYEGVGKKEIIDYVNSREIKKIAVTYDSLERLIMLLIEQGVDVYDDYFLLVDEYHVLFNSYCFRNEAIKKVLEYSRKFREVTFMTATPIEEEFQLKELKDLQVVEVKWYNTVPVNITPEITNDPQMRVCQLILDRLEGKMFGNLHFFVNSVEFIASTIKGLNLCPEDVKVVCSENKNQGRGKKSNQSKLGDYKIEQPLDPVKKINFYTSMAFEGCDIYDKEGRIYIVSDKNKSHTLLDISTLIVQICGRIRDTEYMTDVHHIFSETRYSNHLTLEEFKEYTYKVRDRAKNFVDEMNRVSDDNRNIVIKSFLKSKKEGLNELYITDKDNRFEFDENLINIDIVNYKITHQVYKARVTLKNEYQRHNFNVLDGVEKNYKKSILSDKLIENRKAKISFKDLFEEYVLLKEEQLNPFHFGNIDDRRSLIEEERPLIKQAYDKLGVEEVRKLKYNNTNIKREIYKRQADISTDRKIIKFLDVLGIRVGVTKSASDIKLKLQDVYNALDIVDYNNKIKKAKATDLDNWFEIDKTTPKINGKTTDCYTIVRSKIIFK
ncbi:DEAD/DEAH box helicase family protein [Dysgonomonas massiliensis]|uniref:DEAD/DEAH box helicase family protein n=1 Tax=Dysgonomonas massiliensis TaxID=2040292 RepID=UPI000C761A20|nr:DEAD/DEAH box helicase family protein [Dysgonomonas massiliensis]